VDNAASPHATPADEFRIEETLSREGTVVLTVSGDVDLHVAGELKDRLAAAADKRVSELVLDFSQVTFVDSMGLGVLLAGMKRMRAAGGELRLIVPRPELRRVLEITRMDRILPLHDTLSDALAAAGPQAPGK
jgi:anti-sigma B factor antagonist